MLVGSADSTSSDVSRGSSRVAAVAAAVVVVVAVAAAVVVVVAAPAAVAAAVVLAGVAAAVGVWRAVLLVAGAGLWQQSSSRGSDGSSTEKIDHYYCYSGLPIAIAYYTY